MEKTTPSYLNHRKRLKERFCRAPEAMPDAELLELLLGYVIRGKDVKPQARAILDQSVKLCNIFDGNLKAVKGIGEESALFFDLLREFISRMDYQKMEKKPVDLSFSGDVFKFLKNKIGHNAKEVFAIVFLDTKNHLKGCKIIREGFIGTVAVAARDIIENAISNHAAGVIIAHNHPSGDCTPSPADLTVTKQICHALQYTGVTLVDHMIVCYHEYYSMGAHGDIKRFYEELGEK